MRNNISEMMNTMLCLTQQKRVSQGKKLFQALLALVALFSLLATQTAGEAQVQDGVNFAVENDWIASFK
ncbi:MAG: hypothetical protein BWX85_01018 [Chloroflexi bacterium ADurb.Bin120]|jgi:hypothetical protein|uniref:hypothetical protein n=1 Tax=Candidatus Brevifilum fermentans TaxID=1986204 RepID=UPI0009C7AEA2|nr:hypothetical protein [Brevefilum fermentans]MDI9566115.1 hypothetical protein [Chloroflexota bacterium]OQB84287.1 MAG: hypothetical protein BWX85_01018 [Chloroflexi bacterium ADurb.Bin120]HOM67971.1 hypothetical protein [Brevefilum fermentans]